MCDSIASLAIHFVEKLAELLSGRMNKIARAQWCIRLHTSKKKFLVFYPDVDNPRDDTYRENSIVGSGILGSIKFIETRGAVA